MPKSVWVSCVLDNAGWGVGRRQGQEYGPQYDAENLDARDRHLARPSTAFHVDRCAPLMLLCLDIDHEMRLLFVMTFSNVVPRFTNDQRVSSEGHVCAAPCKTAGFGRVVARYDA